MLETLGERQQQLLSLLLDHKAGLTVDDLSGRLQITRNAVRQHLAALERDDLVRRGDTNPSGGRPEQLYLLSDRGAELFPRRYSWFSELLIEAIAADVGRDAVGAKLDRMGREVGAKLRAASTGADDATSRVAAMAKIMQDLGYAARVGAAPADDTIEASNCVFHHLAAKFPEVCRFDLGLIGEFAEAKVDHQECMVRGGHMCRFRLIPARKQGAGK
ncbi:MAG: helix-turn-helix transcriptional regulator [Dongiaceae bacterium]